MILLTVAVLLFVFWLYWRKKNEHFWKHLMAIPGPKHYPILGNFSELIITDGVESFQRDRELNKLYPSIFRVWLIDVAFVGLSNPEDIELVLSNPKHIGKGLAYDFLKGWLGTGLVTSNGKKWQDGRKILTPAFHFSILQEFVSVFNRSLQLLLKDIEKMSHQDYVDVNKPVTQFALNAIGESSMGLNFNEDSRCESYKKAVLMCCHILSERVLKYWLRIEPLFKFTKLSKQNDQAIETLHDFSTTVIKERKAQFRSNNNQNKRMAMLDLMLNTDIDDEGIREEVDTFMFAGHDTTGTGISHILMVLANEPEIEEEVYREIIEVLGSDTKYQPTYSDLTELSYMERCIKEVLRLYPSIPAIARVAGEDTVTSTGYTIPKGADIAIFIYDLHRNPKIWENPEKFDPDRFLPDNIAKRHPYSYIPFSAGLRNCIGQKYAMLEMKAAVCAILRKFKLVPVDRPQDIVYKLDLVLRSTRDLRVKFLPRLDK